MGATATSAHSNAHVEAAARVPGRRPLPTGAAEALAVGLVACAAAAAFAAERLVAPTNLALVFVLPVVVSAVAFHLRAALMAAAAGVAAFDLLFLEPRYSLRVEAPSDIWALVLLLAVAVIVSGLAANLRRRAAEAAAAAGQAAVLQQMAHGILHGEPGPQIARLAAEGLAQVFSAPAAVVQATGERCRPIAGEACWSDADEDAARWSIEQGVATRAGAYPHDAARYDVWPVGGETRQALAIDFGALPHGRPDRPERFVEAVAAYLALASRRS